MIYSRSRLLQGYWHEVQDVYLNKGSLQKNEVVSCSFQEITIGVASNSSLGNILMYTYCWSFSRKTEKRFFSSLALSSHSVHFTCLKAANSSLSYTKILTSFLPLFSFFFGV
jgi:hypothetical protein